MVKDKVINVLKNNKDVELVILGTSMGGVYVFSLIKSIEKDRKTTLVDEDGEIVGRKICGYTVKSLKNVENVSIIFLPFEIKLAKKIQKRLKGNKQFANTSFVLFE